MAELYINDRNGCRVYAMSEGKPLFAGRTTECDICLPAPSVSRKHAVFLSRQNICGLKDLDSSNGTFLNGKRLNRSVRLKDGDVIQIGSFTLEFHAERDVAEVKAESGEHGDQTPTPRPVPPEQSVAAMASSPSIPQSAMVVSDDAEAAVDGDEVPAPAMLAENRQTDKIPESAPEEESPPEPAPEPATSNAIDSAIQALPTPESAPEPAPAREKSETDPGEKAASVIMPPPRPNLPPRPEISDDEIGDGADDADFVIEEENGEGEGEGQAAVTNKAAVEAGIVGEFAPDEDDSPQPNGGNDSGGGGGGSRSVVRSGPEAIMQTAIQAGPEFDPGAFPLDANLRQAIEARLVLYSFLADLKAEREAFMARRPKMADAVKAELARQDREMDKIPNAQQALGMIEKRQEKKKALLEKIAEAKRNDSPPPPRPSRDMREAEEMAISQWTICAQSFSEALPAAYAESFRLSRDEPLTGKLIDVDIDPIPLMGGGVYYLALEYLQEEARSARVQIKEQLASAPDAGEKKQGGVLGMFGRGKSDDGADDDSDIEASVDTEELAVNDAYLGERMGWIKQEMAFMEKTLIAEFWKVYGETALKYLPDHENMPPAVRAFLRHGVIGFKPWWMKEDVKRHIVEDCRDDVVHHMDVGKSITNVLYADEYLAAVMNSECTPALDENLEINERNSPNWKADKALRKLINSRSQATLLQELLDSLGERMNGLEEEAAMVDQQIDRLLSGQKNFKALKSELGQKRQAFKVEISKLTKLSAKIKEETLATLQETITETEERFESGELPRPTPEFLIQRECDALHKIGRLLANLKERFMPLVVRDNFQIDTDAVNDRMAITGEVLEMERRDPRIFLETLVASKKKASRVDLRISPTIVLIPSAGVLAYSWNPRGKPEDGRLAIPTCFIRRRIRERQLTYLLADFRWDTSKAAAGMDIMTSETIVAAFMTVRWDWRKRSKEGREKGLVFTEQNDRTNWRRVYEAYLQTAYDGGKKLFQRNYDFYERIVGKYFDLPENVQLLRK